MVTVHTDLLDWLARKIAEAEKGSSKAKKLRNALTFFKALVFLAGPLDGKESMKMSVQSVFFNARALSLTRLVLIFPQSNSPQRCVRQVQD